MPRIWNDGKRSSVTGKDMVLAEKVKELIVDKNYSPYAIIQIFKNSSWPGETGICEKTLCSYIAGDVIPVISTSKPMKMAETEFRGHYILLIANKTNKKGIFYASDVQ